MALPGAPASSSGAQSARLPFAIFLALALIVPAAFGLRMLGSEHFLRADGGVTVSDGDGEYHARRMAQVAARPWRLPPARDPLVAYPEGWPVCWPPGFDYLLGLSRWVGGSLLLPLLFVVLLGALLPWAAWRMARRAGASAGAALVSALLSAVAPMLIEYSRVGRLDHHVLEPLLLLLAGASLLGVVGAPTRRGVAAAGIWLGLAFWLWPSALFAVGVLLGGLLLLPLGSDVDRGLPRSVSAISALAALVLAPLVVIMADGGAWRLEGPSLTPLSFLLVTALIGLVSTRWNPKSRWSVLAVIGSGAIAWLALNHAALDVALSFGGRGGLWAYILEQRPLWSLPVEHILLLVGLLPPLWIAAWALVWRRGGRAERVICLWLLLLAPIALYQLRFLPLLVALSAPLLALALDELLSLARGRWPRRALWVVAGAAAVLLLCLAPTFPYVAGGQRAYPGSLRQDRERLGRFLRRAPKEAGREAVMTSIGLGNYVVHRAQRPIVATALIDSASMPALRDALSFYTTDDEATAREILKRRKVGWVVVGPMPQKRFLRYRRLLGKAARGYVESLAFRLRRGDQVRWLRHELRVGAYRLYRVQPATGTK